MGGLEGKVSKKEKKLGAGGEKIKFPKRKKTKGKKLGGGRGEIKLPKRKKLRSGLKKDKQKKSIWDGTRIEKKILSMHHPSMLVHWWVLVHSSQVNHHAQQKMNDT